MFGAHAAASAPALDLDRVADPAALCGALAPEGLDLGPRWRESGAVRGGWVCDHASASVPLGSSSLSYRVLGSRAGKVDRLVLQLDFNGGGDGARARAALSQAGERLATILGITLSPKVTELIKGEPAAARADWRPSADDGGRRVVHDERQGWVRIRLAVEQSTRAALILSFDNPNAGALWR